MEGWVGGWMDRWIDGSMDRWIDAWNDGQTDGRTDGRTDDPSIMFARACWCACVHVLVRLCAHVLRARARARGRRCMLVAGLCEWLCFHVRARSEKWAGSRVH